jgi:hypothetical protein
MSTNLELELEQGPRPRLQEFSVGRRRRKRPPPARIFGDAAMGRLCAEYLLQFGSTGLLVSFCGRTTLKATQSNNDLADVSKTSRGRADKAGWEIHKFHVVSQCSFILLKKSVTCRGNSGSAGMNLIGTLYALTRLTKCSRSPSRSSSNCEMFPSFHLECLRRSFDRPPLLILLFA